MKQEETMNNNRKHEIVEPLTLFDLYGSLSSIVETGKEKLIDIQILVPNFVNGHLKGYETGRPVLNASGCETDNETGYDIGNEKLVRVSISSSKRSDDGKNLFFEGSSDDGYNIRIYVRRINNRILKYLKFT